MFQVIAAIFGFATSANDKANAQYMLDKQEQQSGINYGRTKNMMALDDASKQGLILLFILLVLVVISVILIRKN
jgi:hypothetical protein